ncbi:hypothetical protein B841_11625 [Corynebacterium maris DSM 45190]|uniref:Uncharacterized protein n=1 Tax=Corynebacterium maris DSM 45190 TaxID=1224163 RepID=S5SXD6_9CORY|nr:hypothetical protein [Corynebacterium maris]AGS35797.1 hypothetical protein B841_11625 [Corynebacterium maris DSM 45190]
MTADEAVGLLLAEMERTSSPLSAATALGTLGVNPFHVAENQIRFLLVAVRDSGRFQLSRVGAGGDETIPSSVPVTELLDELHRSPSHHPDPLEMLKPGRTDPLAADRVEAMKHMLIRRA